MAAVYLDKDARKPPRNDNSFRHSRNLSTISNTTLFTSTTLHQPAESLLHMTTVSFDDPESHRDETIGHRCEDPDHNLMNEVEEKGFRARACKRPLKWQTWLKLGFQVSLPAWAIYNTVRYFMAFANFGDSTVQTFCLALGTSTGISFLLAFISFLLAIRESSGVVHGYLSYFRLTLDYLSSFCLLGPVVVNFAVLFIWKDSVHLHLNVDHRCHLDIDVIWSVSNTLCNNESPKWAIWLALSVFRLALTLIITIGYHILSSLYHKPRTIRNFQVRTRTSEPSTPEESVPLSPDLPLRQDSSVLHQLSDYTLCGTSRGEPSPQSRTGLARSRSSLSQDTSPTEPMAIAYSTIAETENVQDPIALTDPFHSMISQITHETDEALDLAHSGHSSSPENMNDSPNHPPLYQEDSDDFDVTDAGHFYHNGSNVFNLPPFFPVLGYNEFGLPYPPDQNVWVLNGYIRRMPTIESMGSGEVGSSIDASSNPARASTLTSSRPPTRNTLLSYSTDHDPPNSEPPSRNSLSACAELLVGLSSIGSATSEHGELLGRTSPVAWGLSTPINYDHAPSDTSGSRGTSYHTAMSLNESFLPPGLSLDTPPRSPCLE